MTPNELDILISIIQRAPMSPGEVYAIEEIIKREQRAQQIAAHVPEKEHTNGDTQAIRND